MEVGEEDALAPITDEDDESDESVVRRDKRLSFCFVLRLQKIAHLFRTGDFRSKMLCLNLKFPVSPEMWTIGLSGTKNNWSPSPMEALHWWQVVTAR